MRTPLSIGGLRRTLLPLFVLSGLAFCSAVQAQDAAKIIDQYLKAQGGRKALSKIQTLTLRGTFPDGEVAPGTFTFYLKSPNRYYSELIVNNQPQIAAYNGKSAWHQEPRGAPATLLADASSDLETAAQYYNSRLLDLKKVKIAAAYVGRVNLNGRDTLHVELTSVNGAKRELFFDTQTHLLLKESAQLNGVNEELIYTDYRPEAGIQLPHAIELHRGPAVYTISLTRAAINAPVGERVFDFPKSSQVQLPDLKALFKEIDDNQKAIDKIRENYAGTRIEDETEFENDGRVEKHEVKEYTFFFLDGEEISTLIKKENQPLAADDQRKETEKTKSRIEEVQKRQAKKDAKEEKNKEEGKESDEDPGIEVFLRACQFVNPRRERFRGQDVLVFDFEPNPDFKGHTLEERFVQKLAGVVWIDEKARDVVRLEAYFVGDMRLAAGLFINLQKGTSFVLEQEYVNNEVWLPTYQEAHVGVRFLLVKGVKVNAVTRYSDYKKFNVETLSTIENPKISPRPTSPQNQEH
jgi:outer membrane lipoprotein-sorting protein